MNHKKVAYLGLLIALEFIFSYVECLIPIHLGVPGVKLGLANLVVIVAIYTFGEKAAFCLSAVRIILVAFTFGNLSGMLYSLAGGMLSFLVMAGAKKTGILSVKGVSVLGGVFHNIGQLGMAILMLETSTLIFYLPVLMIAGTIAGLVIGILGAMVTMRISEAWKVY